jgi:hypothetical protein
MDYLNHPSSSSITNNNLSRREISSFYSNRESQIYDQMLTHGEKEIVNEF